MSPGRRCCLLTLALLLLRCWVACQSDLKVEEAYYWCYAQHLAGGYFDHPPMVAWLIALAQPLGHSALAVRLPALLLTAGSAGLVYGTLRRWWDARTAEVGVWLHAVLPAFALFAIPLLPDVPLMFFWWLGIYATTRLVQDEQPRWWWIIGLACGLGMDSKYPAALIPLHAFLALGLWRRPARLSLNGHMVGAACLAVALFTPVLAWNAGHEWASFRFQAVGRFGEAHSGGEKAAALLYPALMLGPVLYLALPWLLSWAWRRRDSEGLRFGLCWTLPFTALLVVVGSARQINLNWPLPAYTGVLLLLAPWLRTRPRLSWMVVPALLLTLLPHLAMVVPIPSLNRLDDLTQWQELKQAADRHLSAMPRPERTFTLGYGYQTCSELAWFGWPSDRLVSVNALGLPGLSYDYWTDPRQFAGWDALVITYERVRSSGDWDPPLIRRPQLLSACFQRLEGPTEVLSYRGGAKLRRFLCWSAFNYRGPKNRDEALAYPEDRSRR